MFLGSIIGVIFFYYINGWTIGDFLLYIRYTVNDFFFLQSIGFPVASVTGVIWYMSSFLLSIVFLFPFLAKFGKSFSLYIAPMCTILISGLLIHNFGSFEVPASWLFECVNTGNLRAISMMCLGVFLYEIASYAKVFLEKQNKIAVTVLEIFLYYCFFMLLHLYSEGSGQFDEQVVFLFACGFLITESECSYTTCFKQSKVAFFLGKYSVALFWGHFIWVQNAQAFATKIGFMEGSPQILGAACALLSSFFIMYLEVYVRKIAHRIFQLFF